MKESLKLSIAALLGASTTALAIYVGTYRKKRNPETDYSLGHELVWNNISGAMNASMIYIGDRLQLYKALKELCQDGKSVTAVELADHTGLSQRWLREWMAQQAAIGILILQPGEGNDDASLYYRLPFATSEVLANPDSNEYDVSMVQMVPALVSRAKTMLPEAFQTGIGRPYDDMDVAEAIDRQHSVHVRSIFIPKVLLLAFDGKVLQRLEAGCQVSDLGCGAGILVLALAKRFPKSTFHAFEVSKVALEKAAHNLARERLTNVFFHDATQPRESLGDYRNKFDVSLIFDVLHDCVDPADLIRQVRTSIKEDGVFVFADIPSQPTIRENLKLANSGTMYGFSTCLCMSCALSEKGGAGLGTLGFSIPVAKRMLTEGGFRDVEVLIEEGNTRWFQAFPY